MTQNKPRHILFISGWYPHKGKPFDGIFIQKLARCIQQQPGWQVSNISFHAYPGRAKIEETVNEGIHEVRLYYPANGNTFFRHEKLFQQIKSISKKLAASYGPIALVQANIMPFAAWYAYRLALHFRVPWGVREGYSVYLNDQFLEFPWLKRKMTRFLARKAHFTVAISTALSEALQRHFSSIQAHVIPNPILPQTQQARQPDLPPRIVSIADFYPYKNLDLLIEAFSRLHAASPDWTLDLYGKGDRGDQLQQLVKHHGLEDKVFFKGTVENPVIYQVLPNYHFLVISSAVETFSNVGIEALACGVPVLATDCGGPRDFITADNGMLVAPNAVEELEKGLEKMMQTADNYDRAAIQQAAVERFSMDTVGQQYVSLYEQVLQP